MKIAILIPTYNHQKPLNQVLREIREQTDIDIMVIDDGSNPKIELSGNSISLIRNQKNRGKGYSLQKGFKEAIRMGFTHIITMDSDLQHSPDELNQFINSSEKHDLVLGYREKDSSMPFHRKLSNSITTFLISMICKYHIYDSQCGYRRYSLNCLKSKVFCEYGYQFESEILIKTIYPGISIKQEKIKTIYEKNNKSYINNVSDTIKFISLYLKSLL